MVDFNSSNLSALVNRPVTGGIVSSSDHEAWRNDLEGRVSDSNSMDLALESNFAGTALLRNVRGKLWADITNAGRVTLKLDPDGSGADSEVFHATEWPVFETVMSANQTVSAATPTKVVFDTETFDTNSDFDSTTNYRFTPTVAGKYLLSAAVLLSGYDDSVSYIILYKNGSAFRQFTPLAASSSTTGAVPWIVDANGTSDYFEIFVDSTADTSYTVEYQQASVLATFFAGSRIG